MSTDKLIDAANDAARQAKYFLYITIIASAFALLMVLKTTDAKLLQNTGTVAIVGIGIGIRTVSFYKIAPFVLLALYGLLHLHLHSFWERMARLRGLQNVHLVTNPWLGSHFVRSFFERSKHTGLFSSRLHALAFEILAWWCVPLVLVMIWYRFLPVHLFWWSGVQVFNLGISLVIWIVFWNSTRTLLLAKSRPLLNVRDTNPPILWISKLIRWGQNYFKNPQNVWIVLECGGALLLIGSIGSITALAYHQAYKCGTTILWILAFGLAVGIALLSCCALYRTKGVWVAQALTKPIKALVCFILLSSLAILLWFAALKRANTDNPHQLLANPFTADFSGQSLSSVTNAGWYGTTWEEIASVKGPAFADRDLKKANFYEQKMIGGNFKNAHLNQANLRKSWLHDANLFGAKLVGAQFDSASLMFARLDSVAVSGLLHCSTFVRGTNIYGVIGLDSAQIDTLLRCRGAVAVTQEDWLFDTYRIEVPNDSLRKPRWEDSTNVRLNGDP